MSQYEDYSRLLEASVNGTLTDYNGTGDYFLAEQPPERLLRLSESLGAVGTDVCLEAAVETEDGLLEEQEPSEFSRREQFMLDYLERFAGTPQRRRDFLRLFPDATPAATSQQLYKLMGKLEAHPDYADRVRRSGVKSTTRYWLEPHQSVDGHLNRVSVFNNSDTEAWVYQPLESEIVPPAPSVPTFMRQFRERIAAAESQDGTTDLSDLARMMIGASQEGDWQERALCAETDPEAFFPEHGGSTREAKKICTMCEVRPECLEYALENGEDNGIWGGLSERERRRSVRRLG